MLEYESQYKREEFEREAAQERLARQSKVTLQAPKRKAKHRVFTRLLVNVLGFMRGI